MINLGAVSYGAGSLFFLVLALVLLTGHRGRSHKFALMLASMASALWMASAAWAAYIKTSALWPYLLEPLRDFGLLAFLALLLYAPNHKRTIINLRYKRVVGLLLSCAILLMSLVLYRTYGGGLSAHTGSIDWLFAGYLGFAITGLVLVEQIIRNVRQESRRAIKYICIGFGAIFAYDFYLYSHALLFQGIDPNLWASRGLVNALVVPVLGVAVARDPYWSHDIFVSRRAAFHTTALLGSGVYMLAMGAGGYFVRVYGGSWGAFAQIIFLFGALLILLILLFSNQLRANMRVFFNKHFFHYKYEYRDEWLRFSDTLTADEPDMRLRERSIRALADILESPGGVLCLYRGSSRYEPVASWQMPLPEHGALFNDSSLMKYFRSREWVVNIDEYHHEPENYEDLELPVWMLESGQAWLIVPLFFHDRLLGIIILARPQVVPPLNWEDYDLLRTAGRQAAAHLAQLDAAQALAEAKQFEASNRLSAYVMHDLKNLIAQLSLVVSNSERHKANPQFMDDVIRTVDNSVNKMNALLVNLRSGGSTDRPVKRVDLCNALHEVVEMMSAGLPVPSLDCQAKGLDAWTEPDRFVAVVGHVVRNAQDATPDEGHIIVRLFKQNDQAVIEVQDDGCGMDERFIRERLFKPFDSTKGDSGMGIGAHETRAFIKAMGGEVDVISRLGEGTTFRLAIPVSEDEKNSVRSTDTTQHGSKNDNDFKEIASS